MSLSCTQAFSVVERLTVYLKMMFYCGRHAKPKFVTKSLRFHPESDVPFCEHPQEDHFNKFVETFTGDFKRIKTFVVGITGHSTKAKGLRILEGLRHFDWLEELVLCLGLYDHSVGEFLDIPAASWGLPNDIPSERVQWPGDAEKVFKELQKKWPVENPPCASCVLIQGCYSPRKRMMKVCQQDSNHRAIR
jgi:hypothetical protein